MSIQIPTGRPQPSSTPREQAATLPPAAGKSPAPSQSPHAVSDGFDTARAPGPVRFQLASTATSKASQPAPQASKPGFLKKVGKFFKGAGARIADAGRSLANGVLHTATGIVKNLVENGQRIGKGLGQIFRGQLGSGAKNIFGGLLDGTLGTVADASLMVLGKAVSSVQTLIGVEPPGRRLSGGELEAARAVFGDSIDLSAVRVKEGGAGLFDLGGAAAFVHGNTIYVSADNASASLITHELVHVWQHQNGGTDYMREALISQNWGKGYDWKPSVPGTPWEDLEPEQQAEVIEVAFRGGYFDPSDPNYGTFFVDGQDQTVYLQDAVAKLRASEGAP